MNGPSEEEMGGVIVCDKVCLGVPLISSLFPCDRIHPPWLMEFLGIYDDWVPLGGSVFRWIKGNFSEYKYSLYLLLFKSLQLKIIHISKQYTWGWNVLLPIHSQHLLTVSSQSRRDWRASAATFTRSIILFPKVPPLWPNHLLKTPRPGNIKLGLMA